MPGAELYWDTSLAPLERWYCRLLGVPIVGLRIRLRRLRQILPKQATRVLDAGCGRGVITRTLARRYEAAEIDAVDENAESQAVNEKLTLRAGLTNCHFITADLLNFEQSERYDLIVSVDNLEHVERDDVVLEHFYRSMAQGGTLVVHVPHYYRRWPVFGWCTNFDVPGHVRPGYHLSQLRERVHKAGFEITKTGFTYGFTENLMNNVSYAITRARQQNKVIYAAVFPMLNLVSWFGQWSRPRFGAGVWVVATKEEQDKKRR